MLAKAQTSAKQIARCPTHVPSPPSGVRQHPAGLISIHVVPDEDVTAVGACDSVGADEGDVVGAGDAGAYLVHTPLTALRLGDTSLRPAPEFLR